MSNISGKVAVKSKMMKDFLHGNCRPRVERDRTKYHRKEKHQGKCY